MMAHVVHLEVITVAPNESDTEGDGYVLCNSYSTTGLIHLTHNRKFVTCKNCLRNMKEQANSAKDQL